MRSETYRDQKRLEGVKGQLSPEQVQKQYQRSFVFQGKTDEDNESQQRSKKSSGSKHQHKLELDDPDGAVNEGQVTGDNSPSGYKYRDWREIMHQQQESLNSLVELGVLP